MAIVDSTLTSEAAYSQGRSFVCAVVHIAPNRATRSVLLCIRGSGAVAYRRFMEVFEVATEQWS